MFQSLPAVDAHRGPWASHMLVPMLVPMVAIKRVRAFASWPEGPHAPPSSPDHRLLENTHSKPPATQRSAGPQKCTLIVVSIAAG